ncbi:MAG: hypothetical protein HY730_07520 [Candidatus Tectomicrobia bacterium]|uniref:Uncharacterized protein n=1 Tax=Tectimicrobiota bacterium TaxID=2528274 RepID=A0A933LRB5_UNCTE|nr:hypothetical protein [Candidatus Tectomicrobia bacterium]
MSWIMHHSKSEQYASLAEIATKQGDADQAKKLYRLAAEAETQALFDLESGKKQTLGITAVSAASLWYKAHDFRQAQTVAHKWLATDLLPDFAVDQLQALLQNIWSEIIRERAGVKFTKGEVLISVSGGEVIVGGAPLDLILRKVDEVRGLFYRTAEMLLNLPLRKHGPPNWEIQEQCRPWLFQAPAGSYQFAVRVEKPRQMKLFEDAAPRVEEVTKKFLEIVKASVEDPESELAEVVPDPEYRSTFLKLARNLAPTGKSFDKLEIKSVGGIDFRPIILIPRCRDTINDILKKTEPRFESSKDQEKSQVHGILRALHLDKDWLEVHTTMEPPQSYVIYGAGDAIDDVVGPMVNRPVIVDVVRGQTGKLYFRDIQSDE